jgi:MSHA biogenesis protein MshL
VNGQDQDLPLARSTIRESDSIIRAQSGQIVVIGGLMQDTIDDRDAKTPAAGDVPFFGNLFKHKARSKTKSELIILLRPVVIDSPRRWAEAINDSRHNFGEIRQGVLDWREDRIRPSE